MILRSGPGRCLVTLLLLSIAAAPLPAQQAPRYVERVDVASVVVDVRVIDESGAPILGLAAPDFFVTIGGKRAIVQSSIWTGDAPATARPPDAGAPAETRPEPGQLVVLLFQKSLATDRVRGFIRLVAQSRALVRDLPASDRVAILMFDTRLTVWSDFTNDRAALDRILEHGILHEKPPKSAAQGVPSLQTALTPEPRRVSTIEGAFGAIANGLKPLPGSKAVAFIGYGMGRAPFLTRQDVTPGRAGFGTPQDQAGSADVNAEYAKALRTLTEARVSVFSLDITNADTHTLALGMQAIAADTGGFYASSLDFPEKPMRFVAGALNGHYVLFVQPPEDAPDRTLAVSVASSRPALVYSTSSDRSRGR